MPWERAHIDSKDVVVVVVRDSRVKFALTVISVTALMLRQEY